MEAPAQQGSTLAQRKLGLYYSEGKEVELDLKLASELFEAAATQGDEYAAHSLALMYAHGNSAVPKDLGKAIQWYELAAKKGVALAQHNLAACYANTDGPDRNLRLAAFWFHKAAEQGLRLSMESLSRIYAFGEGVERDPDWAEHWKARAAATEDPNYPATQLHQPVIPSSQRLEVFPSELGYMTSNNMATVIAGLKSFGVSDNFIRGSLFLFAATAMRTSETITPKDSYTSQQWLFPHNINEVADEILGRMDDGRIQLPFEEFIHKLGIKVLVEKFALVTVYCIYWSQKTTTCYQRCRWHLAR